RLTEPMFARLIRNAWRVAGPTSLRPRHVARGTSVARTARESHVNMRRVVAALKGPRYTLGTLIAFVLATTASPAVHLHAQTHAPTASTLKTSSTITSIGVEWDILGDANHDATAAVDYRVAGSTTWRAAMPLMRVDYNSRNMLAGSVLFLAANTT